MSFPEGPLPSHKLPRSPQQVVIDAKTDLIRMIREAEVKVEAIQHFLESIAPDEPREARAVGKKIGWFNTVLCLLRQGRYEEQMGIRLMREGLERWKHDA